MTDSLQAWKGNKPIERKLESAYGVINSSLWNAMVDGGFDANLANELSEVYAWTIDFFGIQKGDEFEVLYDRLYVDNKPIGIGKIRASRFYELWKRPVRFLF